MGATIVGQRTIDVRKTNETPTCLVRKIPLRTYHDSANRRNTAYFLPG